MNLIVLANGGSVALILLGLVIFFAVIALIVFLLRKHLKIGKTEKPTDDKKIADENLSHYLQDVDDEEAQKQFDQYALEHKKDIEDNEEENK
jgi:ACR3 family arsenite efflux pump ArsB